MQTDRCADCRHFEKSSDSEAPAQAGLCHLNPPLAIPVLVPGKPSPMNPSGIAVQYFSCWSAPKSSDWCSHFDRTSRLQLS